MSVLQDGELMVVDPNLEEEAAAQGLMTVIMNAFGELCAVQKTSGIALPSSEVHLQPLPMPCCPLVSPFPPFPPLF